MLFVLPFVLVILLIILVLIIRDNQKLNKSERGIANDQTVKTAFLNGTNTTTASFVDKSYVQVQVAPATTFGNQTDLQTILGQPRVYHLPGKPVAGTQRFACINTRPRPKHSHKKTSVKHRKESIHVDHTISLDKPYEVHDNYFQNYTQSSKLLQTYHSVDKHKNDNTAQNSFSLFRNMESKPHLEQVSDNECPSLFSTESKSPPPPPPPSEVQSNAL